MTHPSHPRGPLPPGVTPGGPAGRAGTLGYAPPSDTPLDNDTLTKVTSTAWFFVAAGQLVVGVPAALIDVEGDNAPEWVLMLGIGGILALLLTLVTFILFLVWLFRAYKNAHLMRRDPGYSPTLAVIWMLIPIVNLLMGYRVIRNLWDVTAARYANDTALERPGVIWSCLIAGVLVGCGTNAAAQGSYQLGVLMSLLVAVLNAAYQFLLGRYVVTVNGVQKAG